MVDTALTTLIQSKENEIKNAQQQAKYYEDKGDYKSQGFTNVANRLQQLRQELDILKLSKSSSEATQRLEYRQRVKAFSAAEENKNRFGSSTKQPVQQSTGGYYVDPKTGYGVSSQYDLTKQGYIQTATIGEIRSGRIKEVGGIFYGNRTINNALSQIDQARQIQTQNIPAQTQPARISQSLQPSQERQSFIDIVTPKGRFQSTYPTGAGGTATIIPLTPEQQIAIDEARQRAYKVQSFFSTPQLPIGDLEKAELELHEIQDKLKSAKGINKYRLEVLEKGKIAEIAKIKEGKPPTFYTGDVPIIPAVSYGSAAAKVLSKTKPTISAGVSKQEGEFTQVLIASRKKAPAPTLTEKELRQETISQFKVLDETGQIFGGKTKTKILSADDLIKESEATFSGFTKETTGRIGARGLKVDLNELNVQRGQVEILPTGKDKKLQTEFFVLGKQEKNAGEFIAGELDNFKIKVKDKEFLFPATAKGKPTDYGKIIRLSEKDFRALTGQSFTFETKATQDSSHIFKQLGLDFKSSDTKVTLGSGVSSQVERTLTKPTLTKVKAPSQPKIKIEQLTKEPQIKQVKSYSEYLDYTQKTSPKTITKLADISKDIAKQKTETKIIPRFQQRQRAIQKTQPKIKDKLNIRDIQSPADITKITFKEPLAPKTKQIPKTITTPPKPSFKETLPQPREPLFPKIPVFFRQPTRLSNLKLEDLRPKPFRLKTAYSASLGAAAFDIVQKQTAKQFKELQSKQFTGAELRPVIAIEDLIPKKKKNIKTPNELGV